jgi:signal transduction histidine kinase
MSRTAPTIAFPALLALASGGASAMAGPPSWLSPELRQIEMDRADCGKQLAALPPAPAPHLTARLGWHSEYGGSEAKAEWVELDLGRPETLDAVVLIAPPPNGGVVGAGYGFPRRFYVELLGEGDEAARTLIADHTGADFPNPGLLPVVIPAGGRQAQKVRITATRLVGEKGRFFFALGEVMLLRGKENLGARIEQAGPLHVLGSSSIGTRPDWGRINLVDGHNAIGPPLGPRPSPSPGYCGNRWPEKDQSHPAWVEIDLGEEVTVDEVRLFPARPARYSHASGYGFPVRWEITLRGEDAVAPHIVPMPESGRYFALPGDNVVTIPCGHRARHVRVNVLEPHVSNGGAIFALAEMQVWSGGKNRAPGASVKSADVRDDEGWAKEALVDGFTSTANIIDWPEWLVGLSQRREMEHRLATLDARQKRILTCYQTIGWWSLAALIAAALVAFTGLNVRRRRLHRAELERLRQRIAQDLHDEIGSSLGSIALIAQDILADDRHAREDLAEIKAIANETADAMRDITRLVHSDRYGSDDLPQLLRDTAERLLRGLDHHLDIDEHAPTRRLGVERQRDLMLIFKEALHNITRHAHPTKVAIRLEQRGNALVLTVTDDGRGFAPAAPTVGMGLANVRRRAGKHRGRVDIASSPQGTTLSLTLPFHE